MLQADKVSTGGVVSMQVEEGSTGKGEMCFEDLKDQTDHLPTVQGKGGKHGLGRRDHRMSGKRRPDP